MRVVEVQTGEMAIPSGLGGPRSPGPHVSQIVRDLENLIVKPGQRKPYEELTPEERRRMGAYVSMGWAWEEIIRTSLRDVVYQNEHDRYVHPEELEMDGITGTPDWLDVRDWCVEEFKCTWLSSRRDIEVNFWGWHAQIKAYCRMLATKFARLRVFFVNGDYRDSGPQIKAWQLEYTAEELQLNWTMLVKHAKERKWIE